MLRIELLSRRHNREGFDCGNPELNDYLQRTARQHTDKGLSRTEVLIDDQAPAEILGYVTLSLAEIIIDTLPPSYAQRSIRPKPTASNSHDSLWPIRGSAKGWAR